MNKREGSRSTPIVTLTVVLALVLAGTLPLHAGEMYRWVDKEGKLHFSDQPPPADAKQSQQLVTPVVPERSERSERSEGDNESSASYADRQRRAAEAIQADRSARTQGKAETAASRAKQQQACTAAKAELERFETANVKFMRDENNQRREMSDAEFKQIETALRAAVDKACR